jgi:hypothetical protein
MMYQWKGFPSPNIGWRYQLETMKQLDADGRIWYPHKKTAPYALLPENPMVAIGTVVKPKPLLL